MDDSHKLEWKIYWTFRNGDYNLAAELLACYWMTESSSLKLDSIKGNYDDTLLHLACQNGWLDYVKLLIGEFRCEPEVKDCGNQTPLHYACHYGHLNIVQYLLRIHNCDVAVATRDHWTPLHYACRYGHLNIVEYILDIPGVTSRKQLLHVACVYNNNGFLELVYLTDKQKNLTSIQSVSIILLQIACSFHQVQIVEYLCNKHGSHWYLNDTKLRRLFIFCCKYGLLEIVTQLRVNVADHVDTRGKSGLHYACQEGHISIAKYLIEVCGCDINKVDRNGCTPLHLACQHSHNIDIIKYMLSEAKCDPTIRNEEGETPIHLTMLRLSDTECLDIIKDVAAILQWNFDSRCNSEGDTVLHLSVRHHKPRVTQFLISEAKCDPNIRNVMGEMLIELLISVQNMWPDSECSDIVKALVATKQWDPNSNCNSKGDTALHLAARNHRHKTINLLLSEAKCDPYVKNQQGETPVHTILSKWSDSECFDVVKDIVSNKQWDSSSRCNSEGDTILHLSVRYSKPRVTQFLLSEAKCNLSIRNNMLKTPIELMISAAILWSDSKCVDIIKPLVMSKQWDSSSKCNFKGDTTLHLAVRNHKPKTVNLLLSEAKCDPYVRNERGETPIHLILSIWLDSECFDFIRDIVATKQFDPSLTWNSNGDTALHLSVRYHKPRVTQFLLSEAKCNPNIKNKIGKTPIELLLSDIMWYGFECIEIIKALVASKQWDPNSRYNSNSDTALHLSVRYHKPRVTQFLLSEAKCNPNIQNTRGETPIKLLISAAKVWSDSECVGIIKVLVATRQWDPNSNCNFKGDTALHLAVRNHKPKIVNLLLSEAKCNPNIRNKIGKTPIELLLSDTKMWYGSECIEMIKALVAIKQWDPNSRCNSNGDTALHLSVRYHKPRVTQFLLSEAKSNPNIQNTRGETPIKLLISAAKVWSDSECVGIIKVLVATRQWDPNSNCNFKGDTALHLAVRNHKPRIVNLLLSEAKCNPNIRNKIGKTPIELLLSDTKMWYGSECIEIIKALVATKQWDPNSWCNSNGDTALHLSVRYHKPRVTQFLLFEAKCNPNIQNTRGETPIELLISATKVWSNSECIGIIKALVASKQWDPNSSCNSNGDIALHLSVRHHRPRVVHYLLSETKSDPNSKNSNGKIPLHLALTTDIINDLIRHGSNPDNVYKSYGISVGLKGPLIPPIKVFIIGNSGVGKSTLTEALKIEASLLTRALNFITRRRVSDIDEKTAGIVPHDFESKNYGHVTFYDFAGHREFYSSHAAFLHNVVQGSSPIFLLVVNMSDENDIIQRNILYWLSFIENQCSAINCTSHVIVIGSHADIVLSGGDDPLRKAMEISECIKKIFQNSIVAYVGIYPMDCQFPESPGMTKLRHCLIEICNAVRIQKVITFNAHCFHVFLLDKFRTSVAVAVQEIQDQVMKEQDMKEGIVRFLPDTPTTICKVCNELNNRGHILFLNDSKDIENSWVIIDKARLLSEVTGTIFAPKDFKQHCQLAESTGVVPLSRLTIHFPDLKTDILIGFMTHLEFCREILDSDLLELIMKHQKSTNKLKANTVISESEHYFLFPGLITQQAPDNLWQENQDFKYHCGWILQCTHPDQFFSSRLLQVLLLRLAFSFALIKLEVNKTIPAFQRECSIWKNGIFWGEIFGMEAIVEVHSNNKTVVFQCRCQEESLLHCITQRSHIIRKILQCVHDFCPQIKTTESFINPSEATKFPIQLLKLPQYTVQKIAEAIINSNDSYPLSGVSSTQIIPLDRLLTFEPYAEIGLSMLKHLYSDHVKKFSDQELETLSLNLSKKSDLFVRVFRLKSQSTIPSSPTPENLLTVLKQWRDRCEGTYKCLKEKLDQYSVFAGRNVLELSGVPIQIQCDTDDTDDTRDTHDDQDQIPPKISTIASPIADDLHDISKEMSTDVDKPLQELPDCDDENESATNFHPDKMAGHCDSEEGDTDISTKVYSDREPKLSELQLLKGRGGRRVKVIEGVAYKWKELAMSLDFNGPQIESIDMGALRMPEEACRQMLVKWLDGDDELRGPVTWATLIQCMIDAGLVDMADRLKELIDS